MKLTCAPFAVAMARSADVEQRVDQILHYAPASRRRVSAAVIAALAVATIGVTLVAPQAQLTTEPMNVLWRVSGVGINPTYPERAQQEGVEGWATFRVSLDAAGRPKKVTLLEESPTGYGFGENAQRAIETWRFENASRQPVDGVYKVTLRLK